MGSKAFRKVIVVLAGMPLMLATACSGGADAVSGDTSVKVGMVQPLSGAISAIGEESQAGFKFVIDQVNAAGGIKSLHGSKIQIVLADDANVPGNAATEGRRLMGQEKVSLVVGSLLTGEMAAISPTADQFKVPVLSMFAGGTNSDYLYTMGFPYGDGYAANFTNFIDYLNKEMGANIKTAALASSNYEAGQAVDKELQPRLEKVGVKVIGSVPLDQGATDLKPAVTKLDSLKPDVVTGLVTTKDGISLHKARGALNSPLLFVGGTTGYSDPSVWQNLGAATAKKVLAKNTFGMTGFNEAAKQQHLKDFLTQAKAANLNVPIGQNFVQGAQAARLVVRILEAAGSTEPDAVYKAFAKVEIKPGDPDMYLTKVNGLKFNDKRVLTDTGALMVQWNEDGTQDVVWPPDFASRKPTLTK